MKINEKQINGNYYFQQIQLNRTISMSLSTIPQNSSIDFIQFPEELPLSITTSSTRLSGKEIELEIMKTKYNRKADEIRRKSHQKKRSNLQKISKIIRDASDLREILDNTDKWLQKRQGVTLKNSESIDLTMSEFQLERNNIKYSNNTARKKHYLQK